VGGQHKKKKNVASLKRFRPKNARRGTIFTSNAHKTAEQAAYITWQRARAQRLANQKPTPSVLDIAKHAEEARQSANVDNTADRIRFLLADFKARQAQAATEDAIREIIAGGVHHDRRVAEKSRKALGRASKWIAKEEAELARLAKERVPANIIERDPNPNYGFNFPGVAV